MGRSRLLALALTGLLLAAVGFGAVAERGPAASGSPGRVTFIRNATSSFDPYLTGSSPSQRRWMRSHYDRMRGYPPFFDRALGWAPPADFYKDLYALYPADRRDRRTISKHPGWVLRSLSGRKLYIPYACGRHGCPALAADPGNHAYRRKWIAQARHQLRKGYAGIFIDNVNLDLRVSDRWGKPRTPTDPRTGRQMTPEDWSRYVAGFTARIRGAFPHATIAHNALWFAPQSNPNVVREAASADYVELERGFNDRGITGGAGAFGYETLLAHVDWLHSLGAEAIFEPDLTNAAMREYELAGYFLVSDGGDAIASSFQADPGNWWRGWDVDLGTPTGARYVSNGLLRRDFTGGEVLVNEPGAPTRTQSLDGPYRTVDGELVISVTLGPGEGVVLLRIL